jgi:3-oxoacyl-[acyl-carrier protein] reductase
MDLGLTGKRALVTGSTSGIGAATAKLLAEEGVIVAVHGRDRARGEAVVREIEATGGQAMLALGDLSSDAGAAAVGDAIEAKLGGIDILFNNAALTGEGHTGWFDEPIEHWVQAFQSKPFAAARMIRRFVPGMVERRWGRVIANASASAIQPIGGIPAQQACYAAMVNMTGSLARSLQNVGVTANTISPGLILTPAVEIWAQDVARQQGWPEDWDAIENKLVTTMFPLPCGRIGRGLDIAAAVAFLSSDLAGYITGANLRIDGGQVQCI